MTAKKNPSTLQEILRRRQQEEFVGREKQLAFFAENLRYSPKDPSRRFVIHLFGQGGVGKTWLLRRFHHLADGFGAVTAWSDEAEEDVPGVMRAIAEQFEAQGHAPKTFSQRYKVYRQRRQEIETDPEISQRFPALLGQVLAKGGLRLARRVPVGGIIADFADEEMVATLAGDFAAHVARKIANRDEVRLVLEPVEVLTPLFLADLRRLAEKHLITLILDSYERTGDFLDGWLRDVLEGRHGDAPVDIILVISGREEMDHNLWAPYQGLMARMSLDPFTEAETRDYLARKGITDERVVDVILHLSGRLPLLVATLAAESPDDPKKVGDPAGQAVERFLKWVEDSNQRRVALDAALPRHLNRDVLALLLGEEHADALFTWLTEMPFVEKRRDGWAYHDVVRTQILRYKRQQGPQSWASLHGQLAEYYERLRDDLGLGEEVGRKDETWHGHALEASYHRLCQAPHKHLPAALNGFLAALQAGRALARRSAETVQQAGRDTNAANVRNWGEHLVQGLRAYDEGRYDDAASMFSALVAHSKIEDRCRLTALLHRIVTYLAQGCFEEALADLDRVIELAPAFAWALASRGVMHRVLGRYKEAVADFERLIELEPTVVFGFCLRGDAYVRMGRYEEALADFDRATEVKPTMAVGFELRGETYRLMERYEEALADLDRAIELDPALALAVASRGQVYQVLERYEETLADFTRAIELEVRPLWRAYEQRGETYRLMGRYGDALADLNRAIELEPEYAMSLALRGQVYRALGRYDEALADFTRAIELEVRPLWRAYEQRGETYGLMGRYEEALADLNRVIELEPEYAMSLALRGLVYRALGRYEEALADFTRAIESEVGSPWTAYAARGETYGLVARYEEASADLDRAIILKPDYPEGLAIRGQVYHALERYEEALADLDRAIELQPGLASALAPRGQIHRTLKHYEEALADFTRAIELEVEPLWRAYGERGCTYRLMERYEEALADLDRAIKLKPDYTEGLTIRGQVYHALERYEDALADLDRAIELGPSDASLLHLRGLTYSQLGRYEEALADLNRTIELEPEDPWAIGSRGLVYQGLERYERALADFDAAIELQPDPAWALAGRGVTHYLMKYYDRALADFDRAIELGLDTPAVIGSRGQAYVQMARYEEALADFTRAIELRPDEDWYLYCRGLTSQVLDQAAKARADLGAAIERAREEYDKRPQNWGNTLHLALYHLVAGGMKDAARLYGEVLSGGAWQHSIREAIRELDDFLTLFPKHLQAQAMRGLLQAHLEGETK